MHVEFLSHWSGHLNREMPVNRYGHAGMPIVVFPTTGGTFHEFADFGMINAARDYINAGKVQFFTLHTVDEESWNADYKSPHDRALMHQQFERYLIEEAVPFIKHKAQWFDPMMAHGCSMGAYHALNFFLKHPDVFSKVLALSGIYDARFFVGEYHGDPLIYENSPKDYIWQMNDDWFLNHYRAADIVVVTGKGAWEQDGFESYYAVKGGLEAKGVPAWFDEWGDDVAHDWVWWRQQLPYYLGHLFG